MVCPLAQKYGIYDFKKVDKRLVLCHILTAFEKFKRNHNENQQGNLLAT